LGDETFIVLKDRVEKTPICTSSIRWVRVKILEQYKGSNDCGIWVCNAIWAYLTQFVIRQRLLENLKGRDISTDVGIIRGDFSGAELECDVSAQHLGIMGRKHMMRIIQQKVIDPTDEVLQSVCFLVN
jgi:hypothetical protein